MEDWKKYLIWAVVAVIIFAVLWRKGVLDRFRDYLHKTRDELRKCSWPTRSELRVSTSVVFVSVFLLTMFSLVVDTILTKVVTWLI